jgi:hypothetical protein
MRKENKIISVLHQRLLFLLHDTVLHELFLASSTATCAASSHPLSELPIISIVLFKHPSMSLAIPIIGKGIGV